MAAIGLAHHSQGGHCGTYYELLGGGIALLHFAFHNSVISEPKSAFYFDIPSSFPEREQFAISDFCRLVSDRHGSEGLRFAATRNETFLPKDAALKFDKPGIGFSCASFVKAIFDAVGVPLIEESSWPPATLEDRAWFSNLLSFFRWYFFYKVDQDHFNQIDVSCKWSRYKPEQIAFAASKAPPLQKYSQVRKGAQSLMREVIQTVPALPQPTLLELQGPRRS